ncbi:MAG: hypothetical protein WC534_01800 [Candidatus Paceibacterota bacterium]
MEEYTKEFFWETYKTLPEELKEAVFDEKNNQIIYNICSRLGLDEDQTSIVAKYTGRVLMGLLSLKDFGVTLELELNINEFLANKITQEINFSIFKHLRLALSRLEEQKTGKKTIPDLDKFIPEEIPEDKKSSLLESEAQSLNNKEEDVQLQGGSGKIKFPIIKSLKSFLSLIKEKKPKTSVSVKSFTKKEESRIDLSDKNLEEVKKPSTSSIDFTELTEPTLNTEIKNKNILNNQSSYREKIDKESSSDFSSSDSSFKKPDSEPNIPKPTPISESKNTFNIKNDYSDPYREAPL